MDIKLTESLIPDLNKDGYFVLDGQNVSYSKLKKDTIKILIKYMLQYDCKYHLILHNNKIYKITLTKKLYFKRDYTFLKNINNSVFRGIMVTILLLNIKNILIEKKWNELTFYKTGRRYIIDSKGNFFVTNSVSDSKIKKVLESKIFKTNCNIFKISLLI